MPIGNCIFKLTKRISIFGSTGSIGQNTLDLVRRDRHLYQVVVLTGGKNIEQLVKDSIEFHPEVVVTAYPDLLNALKTGIGDLDITVAAGDNAILEAADRPADWVMSAIVGVAGLAPTLKAVAQGTVLALANKESLVAAGQLLLREAAKSKTKIVPVDSEHSAIFQALLGEDINTVERIIITASGGAFRDFSQRELEFVTPAQAQIHPNWSMGQRITIDSASMFNKAMELIETKEFFGLPETKIEAIIHPESLIHAIVGFNDGGMMAHLGPPDMRHASGFALNYPGRKKINVARIDFKNINQFTFSEADEGRYPALRLAREVMRRGGLWGSGFTAAKEIALDRFIAKEIGFLDMVKVVELTLNNLDRLGVLSNEPTILSDIVNVDQEARQISRMVNV